MGLTKKRALVLILALISVLVFSGCASDAAQGANEGGEKTKVTLAIATKDINIGYPFATLPLAMGWFEEEGLDVTLVPGDSSQGVVQLLESGKADLGVMTTTTGAMATIKEGIPIKSVYGISIRNGDRFVVMADSGIEDVKDLEGKKLGVPDLGSGQVGYAHVRFDEAGVPLDSVEEISVGYGAQAYEALKKGTVDAYVTWASAFALGKTSGYDIKGLPMADWQNDMYNFNLYAADDYIDENSEIIGKIGRAFAKASVFIKTNPEAAVKIFWDQYPERAPKDLDDATALNNELEVLKAQMGDMRVEELPVDYHWGSQEAKAWDFLQQYLYDTNMIEDTIDSSKLFDNSVQDEFINFDVNEIVKQAEEWE
ncbi:ABC transporter substrate-binding protein [Radiobacillus sp. PE A8.2]|uniref:ABC transporter substrate-binding protein n=1 Tax=Radiobacillus sp. PE A8.2 TaxID=3380349 RepID=UPI00388DB6A2